MQFSPEISGEISPEVFIFHPKFHPQCARSANDPEKLFHPKFRVKLHPKFRAKIALPSFRRKVRGKGFGMLRKVNEVQSKAPPTHTVPSNDTGQ